MTKHRFKKRLAFDSRIAWVGCLLLLALLALPLVPAALAHPESLVCLGIIGAPVMGLRMQFLDAHDDANGGWGDLSVKDFQQKVGKGVESLATKVSEFEAKVGKAASTEEVQKLKLDFDKLIEECKGIRKAHLSFAARSANSRGKVTDECARYLAAIGMARALSKGLYTENSTVDRIRGFAGELLGKDLMAKAALTTSDIPLPEVFGSEVVELVSQYGQARQHGTVFPLPAAASVKLPKLKTSPAFGLIAMSANIGEKSPQFEWVTFTPEKWGGLIILPNEIDEDSAVAVGQFIARYAAREMAKIEDVVFFAADGTATYDSLEGLTTNVVTDSKTVSLASTKTHFSDLTLAKMREMRTTVDSAALGMSKYYFHNTFEQLFAGFNTAGDKPYIANGINGASLDGFPIVWIDALPAYSTAVNAETVFGLFGDPSYQYLGTRGGMRFDTSDAPGFTTDQLYIRALERFTIGKMATGAVGGIVTAAS